MSRRPTACAAPPSQPRIPLDEAVPWGLLTTGINLVGVFGLAALSEDTGAVWVLTSLVFLTTSLVVGMILLAISRTRWVGASVLAGLLVTLATFMVFAHLLSAAVDS